jgi:hypothetical protein
MPIELSDRDAKPGARLSSRKDRAERHATVLAPIIAEIRAAGVLLRELRDIDAL